MTGIVSISIMDMAKIEIEERGDFGNGKIVRKFIRKLFVGIFLY